MFLRIFIILVVNCLLIVNIKADTFNEDHALESGKNFNWNDLNVIVKNDEASLAKGITFKMRNNALTIAAERPPNGVQPTFKNILFDGGCLTGGDSCLGVLLDMEKSNFNAATGGNSGNRVRIKNRVIFDIKDNSNFTASRITAEDGAESDFYLKITDSNFTINTINFSNGENNTGRIGEITIKNKSKDDKKVTTINGMRSSVDGDDHFIAIDLGKSGFLGRIDLENAVFDVGGDILANIGIGEIKLNNSSLLFKGLTINRVNDNIILDKASIFKREARLGEDEGLKAKMYIQGSMAGLIEVKEKSEFNWDNIVYDTSGGANATIRAYNEGKIILNDITFYDKGDANKARLEFKIENSGKSNIEINNIDFVGTWKTGDSNLFSLTGDDNSTYKINSLNLNDDNVIIGLWSNKINLKNFNYGGNNLVLNAKDESGKVRNNELTIDTVNIAPILVYKEQEKDANGKDKEGKENEIKTLVYFGETKGEGDNIVKNNKPLEKAIFELNDFKVNFANLKIAANEFTLNAKNSSGKLGNIIFQGETGSNFTFNGNGSSSFEVQNLNAGSATNKEGTANFNSINIKINDKFNYSGNLKVNDSTLEAKALVGTLKDITLSNATTTLGEGSNFSFNKIDIDNASTLNINGSNMFTGSSGVITNKGTFNINATNNINEVQNNATVNFNQGNSKVALLNNSGTVNFYSKNNIDNLSSSAGSINFHNNTSVDTLNVNNTDLYFHINSKTDYGKLIVDNINALTWGDKGVNIVFDNTTIFKPGRFNYFEFINSSVELTAISEDDIADSFSILPPWIRADCFMEDVDKGSSDNHEVKPICKRKVDKDGNFVDGKGNLFDMDGNQMGTYDNKGNVFDKNGNKIGTYDENGKIIYNGKEYSVDESGNILDENSNIVGKQNPLDFDKEIIHTNIIRLTDYKKLMESIPDYVKDTEAMDIASALDNIIDREDVKDNMVDVVNSLDFNSGCSVNSNEGSLNEAHNANDQDVTFDKFPCLETLGENIKKLKAINNSVFLNNSHTNLMDAELVLANSNKEYYGKGEGLTWVKSNLNYNILQNKNYVTGYNKISNSVQVGYSGNIANNINASASVGILGGVINGKQSRYDSKEFGSNVGFAIAYNNRNTKRNFYVGATSLYGFNFYSNQRNIDFMNNQYVTNKDDKANSNVVTNEIVAKLEAGVIFNYDEQLFKIFKDASLFINPNISGLVGGIFGSPYKEKGSSASLDVSGFSNMIKEVSIGIDMYQEVLLANFLYQDYAFWTPKVSFNLIKRDYGNVTTNYKFLNHSDDYMVYSNQSAYDAPLIAQTQVSLNMLKDNITLGVTYKLDVAFNSFVNNSVQAILKYSF